MADGLLPVSSLAALSYRATSDPAGSFQAAPLSKAVPATSQPSARCATKRINWAGKLSILSGVLTGLWLRLRSALCGSVLGSSPHNHAQQYAPFRAPDAHCVRAAVLSVRERFPIMHQHIFIRLLEYGESIGLNGTNFEEVLEWDKKYNYIPKPGSQEYKLREGLLRELFFESFTKSTASTDNIWVLKSEYYFRLLQYRELQLARQSASEAKNHSNIAISISILALLASLVLGTMQLRSEVRISVDQINQLLSKFGYSELKEPSPYDGLIKKEPTEK